MNAETRAISVYGGPQDGLTTLRLAEPLPDFWVHREPNGRESVYQRRILTHTPRSFDPIPYDYMGTRTDEQPAGAHTDEEEVSTDGDEEVRDRPGTA